MKFNIKFPESAAAIFVGNETIEKSAEFVPESVAEVIFNVSRVPRFSIKNVVVFNIDTAELVI